MTTREYRDPDYVLWHALHVDCPPDADCCSVIPVVVDIPVGQLEDLRQLAELWGMTVEEFMLCTTMEGR